MNAEEQREIWDAWVRENWPPRPDVPPPSDAMPRPPRPPIEITYPKLPWWYAKQGKK